MKPTSFVATFTVSSLLYTLATYLLLLRDPFLLERLSISLHLPWLESFGLSLADLLKVNYLSLAVFTFSLIGLNFSFLSLLKSKTRPKLTWIVLPLLFFIFSFPALSTDIFDYHNLNRVAYVHNQNPWTIAPGTHPQDSDIYLGSWINRTSAYPPLMFAYQSLAYLIGGNSVLGALIGFKLITLVSFLIVGFLIEKTLKTAKLKPQLSTLYWYNPLVLIEFVGNTHNDLVMIMGLVAFVYFWVSKKSNISAIVLALAVLAKISVIIYAPFVFIHLMFNKEHQVAFKWLLVFLVTLVLGFLSMGSSLPAFLLNLSQQTSIYLHSLPAIIWHLVRSTGFSDPDAARIQKIISLGLLALICIKAIKLQAKNLFSQLAIVMIAYLILAAPMLQPWYLVWFLPVLIMTKNPDLRNLGLSILIFAPFSYLVRYISLLFYPAHLFWQIAAYSTFSLPLILYKLTPRRWYTFLQSKPL